VDRNYFDTHVLSPDTYGPLLLEGLQQARDTRVPVVSVHRQFRVLIEDHLDRLVPEGRRLVAHPGTTESIRTALAARAGERVLLAVGPEGGWNGFELTLLEAHGFAAVGMGARSLRSDTACIALLALVHDALAC
jgi:RsmE family RNA methyltransferase